MTEETIDVLNEPLDMHLPHNWEQAHGYGETAPFIAVWWTDSGETVHIDDIRFRIAACSKPFFEKRCQRDGLPIVEVTLDLQALNARGELVWLSKSTTIVGFRRDGVFDDPRKQAHYQAMDDLKRIVEEQLAARGLEVRPASDGG